MRCAIYTRKSVEDDFQKEQTSLESQRIHCTKYVESQAAKGWTILPTLYEDYGKTGANMNRPGFQKLLKDIQEGLVDCVVVYKLDRLTRSILDFLSVLDGFFKLYNVSFVSATESFDTTTPVGKLVLSQLLLFAQFEREQTSLRVKDKIRTARTNGIWTGGFIPFGYQSLDRKLHIHPEEATWVQKIFHEYIKTGSLIEIVRELNAAVRKGELKTRSFNYERLRTIICNPVYKGYLLYQGAPYKGIHEALVSEELWEQAHELVHSRRGRFLSRKGSTKMLRGLFRCEECDRAMTTSYTKNKIGQRYDYYICLNKQKGNGCKGINMNVGADLIEDFVVIEVLKILKESESFPGLFESCQEKAKGTTEAYAKLQNMGESWYFLDYQERSAIVRSLVKEVRIRQEDVTIIFTTDFLKNLLGSDFVKPSEERLHTVTIPGALVTRYDKPAAFVPKEPQRSHAVKVEKSLLDAFVLSQIWKERLENGEDINSLADEYNITPKTILRYMVFDTLSPKVQEAILKESLNPRFRIVDFTRKPLPEEWTEQEKLFEVA
ncbi:hypothetical protein AGMMS49949_03160 [Alphaproteobacteria bacterium]|nr:hypothetical protein AGMMS49949_03160 [Alphaproteobacteria bacterium]GHS98553.1 hypothetical protein AGMMS50296_6290 [Alphaproteobacteria bacterium]